MSRRDTPSFAPALALEDELRALCALEEGPAPKGLAFRRFSPSPVDVRLFFAESAALDTSAGQRLLARLSDAPFVESARRRGADATLRLTDAYVDDLLERLLEPGLTLEPPAREPKRFVVNFLNPNATKPLHIGHLRNVAIGQALAAGLEAGGARVVRQCYVCDIGRNVCEALAGHILFHACQAPPEGVRPDVFVGECYARYASAAESGTAGSASNGRGDPIASETVVSNDLADELIGRWMAGDEETLARWQRVRSWALEGQERTLTRLGVSMDRVHYESTTLARVRAFVERGLALGLFERESNGAVVYRSGRSEYPCVQLVRADGFPTEHARVIALFLDEQKTAGEIDRWIVVCGDEWDTAGELELEIAARLGPCPLRNKVTVVAHGMVTLSGSKMKSRDGKALLVDDFLDELARGPHVRALRDEFGGSVEADDLVEIAVKGFFLCRKASKSLEFQPLAFTDPVHNPAWLAARAWARACAGSARAVGRSASAPEASAADPAALRTAALQFHQLRQLALGAAADFAGTDIAKFAIGLSKWYLELDADVRLHRAVHAVLALALRTLGFACAYSRTASK